MLDIQTLLKKAETKPNWDSVNRLVEFVMETAVPFMHRYESRYDAIADITAGESIRTDMTMLLLRSPELVGRLGVVLDGSPPDKHPAEVKTFMRELRVLKVRKIIDDTRKYSVKSVPFCELNLEFFNRMFRAIDASHKDVFDLTLVDRSDLFSEILLRSFNCRDYIDFAEFTNSGRTISEEFFEKNMKTFKEIVGIYEWVQDLESLNDRIMEVQSEEKYNAARTFLKKLLGRPKLSVPLLRKYFPRFDFSQVESLIDSPNRQQRVCQVLEFFPKGFRFLVGCLLRGQGC